MKLMISIAAALLLALAAVSGVSAGLATGTITLLEPATENHPVDILVSISTTAPVVPYEYSVVNRCWFSGKYSGQGDSYERFDLAGPFFAGPDGAVQTTVTINLQPIPEGSACKVYIAKNNTVLKGSTTTYEVQP